jgi:DNA-binding transcriptional regulator Cro
MISMKAKDLIKAAGGARKLASILHLTPQAVYYWGDLVPELQRYRIKELKPHWFRKGGKMRRDEAIPR